MPPICRIKRTPMKRIIAFCFLITCLCSCNTKNKPAAPETPRHTTSVTYAQGFRIRHFNGYTLVTVNNPWKEGEELHRYVLVPKGEALPEPLPEGTLVRTPLANLACLYTTHAGMVNYLGKADAISAVAEAKYMTLPVIRQGLTLGKITDLGEATALNIEKLLEISPEAVLVTPFQNTGYGRLEKTGIPLLECSEYMEVTPLGRAEWIKFLAVFFDKEEEAARLFDGIAEKYREVSRVANEVKHRPTVLAETKYGNVWYVPGGKSYMAHLYADAGADYLWKDTGESGSVGLAFETVYDKAEHADFWVIKKNNPHHDMTYAELKAEYAPYAYFQAWKDKKVILCNTGRVSFYEVGTLEPHLLLADLVKAFHPELLPDHSFTYYYPMKDE